MSVLDDTLKKHRKRVIDREEAAFRELLQSYEQIERELQRSIEDLGRKIREARDRGEEVSPSWLFRERRLQLLIDQVKAQIERFGGTAARITSREQREAIQIAIEQSGEIFRIIPPSGGPPSIGTMLPARVVEDAVGMMGDGTPILEYYKEQLAPRVAVLIRSEVIKGVAAGTDFETIARRLRQTGDITRSRSLAVARTEVNRVRRETTRQIYRENPDIISGWEWAASKSRRTCAVCLAMDGRVFKLKDEFPQHVNCRCTMIPVLIGVTRPARTIGADWFARQPDGVKIRVLGKDAFDSYSAGDVELADFVGWKNDKQFGKSVYRRSLADVLQSKGL